jgi:uncharacterized protein YbjT (DUF2867 family)
MIADYDGGQLRLIGEIRVADIFRGCRKGLLCLTLFFGLATITAAAPPTPEKGGSERVLVLGGTGQLGRAILSELSATNAQVSVLARANSDRTSVEALWPDRSRLQWLTGDLLNAEEIDRALAGHRFDVVINAVRVEDGDIHFYEKIMPPLLRNAKRAGVQQFIHHGAVGAGRNVEKFQNLGWERVPGIFDRLKDQGIGEDLLRGSGVPYTVIRNARLYPPESPATGKAALTEDDSIITPMTRADLAKLTLSCVANAACLSKTFHVQDASLPWPMRRP